MSLPPREPTALSREIVDQRIGTIELLVPALPPIHDAIGEYTELLAVALSEHADVRILTAEQECFTTDSRIPIDPCFRIDPSGFDRLTKRLIATEADAVVLQYNPFAWGRRGIARGLVSAIGKFRQARPEVRFGVMFHETFTIHTSWQAWILRQYQRRQFYRLAESADVCFFSTGVWAKMESRRRPTAKVIHLPVGSNLPDSSADRQVTRDQFGIAEDDFVCGIFGGGHPSRRFDWITTGAEHIQSRLADRRVVLFHVGGDGIQVEANGVQVITTGRLSAEDAANAIAAMDLMLNPFTDGLSTRRGSAIAALQQSIPVASTRGIYTDPLWDEEEGAVVFLANAEQSNDWIPTLDRAIEAIENTSSQEPRSFFDLHFSWARVSSQMVEHLAKN